MASASCGPAAPLSDTEAQSPYNRWDSAKNEMELFTVSAASTAKFNVKFDFAIYTAFGEVGLASGKPAIPNLESFVDMVETISNEIEAESRRLGIIKT